MFFTHLNKESLRPSFFEMFAQERLLPALKPAMRFTFQVFAQRHPRMVPVAIRSDEIFTFLHFILELNSLRKNHASCAEAFYGLRRGHTFSASEALSAKEKGPLTNKEVISSVFFLVFVPYIKQKLDAYYEELSGMALANIFSGVSVESNTRTSVLKSLFLKIYPGVRALYELWCLIQQLLFLFEKTNFYSPFLRMQGSLQVRRLTIDELRESSNISISSTGSLSKFLTWVDRAIRILKIAAITGVFVFKFLEWLITAESKASKNVGFLPPPPTPLRPSSKGITLPPNKTVCPLCRQPRVNPAVCVSSGYVFCYTCIFTYVERESHCPVTRLPATIHDIQRIFHEQGM
eukprot:jgi/Galph1/2686/GphlegSOOS_G1360.1